MDPMDPACRRKCIQEGRCRFLEGAELRPSAPERWRELLAWEL
jgi:hypothetical protein